MDRHEEISKVARELYEKSGRMAGRDEANWLEAERIVKARYAAPAKAKAPKKAPAVKPAKKAAAEGCSTKQVDKKVDKKPAKTVKAKKTK